MRKHLSGLLMRFPIWSSRCRYPLTSTIAPYRGSTIADDTLFPTNTERRSTNSKCLSARSTFEQQTLTGLKNSPRDGKYERLGKIQKNPWPGIRSRSVHCKGDQPKVKPFLHFDRAAFVVSQGRRETSVDTSEELSSSGVNPLSRPRERIDSAKPDSP